MLHRTYIHIKLNSTVITKNTVLKSLIQLSVKCTTKKKQLKTTVETTAISYAVVRCSPLWL